MSRLKSRALSRVAPLLILLALTAPAWPQQTSAPAAAPEPKAWTSLSGEQQRLLAGAGYESRWANLPPERQQALARGSARWAEMTPEQRNLAQNRFSRWRSLPTERRRMLRKRWSEFQRLPAQQQNAVRENFRRFRALPPEERRSLRERWQKASPDERRTMLEHARAARGKRQPRRP